jgi:hypothetical protein
MTLSSSTSPPPAKGGGNNVRNHDSSLDIQLSFQGTLQTISVTTAVTGADLHRQTMEAFFQHSRTTTRTPTTISLKLLYQGKQIPCHDDVMPFAGINNHHQTTSTSSTSILPNNEKKKKMKPLKIIVMATSQASIEELASKRSDPTIRGLDQEKQRDEQQQRQKKYNNNNLGEDHNHYWGEGILTQQDKNYKFCRFQACTWQSFGHRPTDQTPHAFEAMRLLTKLATDPGIVAVMKERELLVGTLAEMDPIDDRLMQKTQQEHEHHAGRCLLLGYNTNGGARIDIKLRTDDLQSFRPYPQLVSTLLHELSHNWVSEHNLLFWTNYGQMRVEYIYTHAQLSQSLMVVRGKTTAQLAGLDQSRLGNNNNKNNKNSVLEYVLDELVDEMHQHGLHPQMIEAPIRQRIQELEVKKQQQLHEQRLGGRATTAGVTDANIRHTENAFAAGTDITGSSGTTTTTTGSSSSRSARELALAAAERRARKQPKKEDSS